MKNLIYRSSEISKFIFRHAPTQAEAKTHVEGKVEQQVNADQAAAEVVTKAEAIITRQDDAQKEAVGNYIKESLAGRTSAQRLESFDKDSEQGIDQYEVGVYMTYLETSINILFDPDTKIDELTDPNQQALALDIAVTAEEVIQGGLHEKAFEALLNSGEVPLEIISDRLDTISQLYKAQDHLRRENPKDSQVINGIIQELLKKTPNLSGKVETEIKNVRPDGEVNSNWFLDDEISMTEYITRITGKSSTDVINALSNSPEASIDDPENQA